MNMYPPRLEFSICCRPARGDWVGLVGETFGDAAVRAMAQRMRDSPTGRQILAERPRVTVSTHNRPLPT